MKRQSLVALALLAVFLLPTSSNTSILNGNLWDTVLDPETNSIPSAGFSEYTGTGDSRTATLMGVTTNETHVSDFDSGDTISTSLTRPAGWTGTSVSTDVTGLRSWYYDTLENSHFIDKHYEIYVEHDGDDRTYVPDNWSIHKENVDDTTQNATQGTWRFYITADIVRLIVLNDINPESDDRVYLSQMLNLPYMDIEEINVRVAYKPDQQNTNYNQTYMFINVGDYEIAEYCFENGDPDNEWLFGSYSVPSAEIDSINSPTSLELQIGMGVVDDPSTTTRSALDLAYVIVDVKSRPLTDSIDFAVNSTSISEATKYSNTFQVPLDEFTSGVSSRDGYNYEGAIFDLDGYADDGALSVAIYPGGSGIARMGLQIPVSIPQGAIITSATLSLTAENTIGTAPDYPALLTVALADQADSTIFSDSGTGIEDYASWIGNPVAWEIASFSNGTQYSSPDLSKLVQLIISNSSWSSGNYISLMVSPGIMINDAVQNTDSGFHFWSTAAGSQSDA
ncbi:MAG: hypothetical protein ACTSUB_00875, partial [Candidatus Thorarchaeota archaeon]